jgi:hypothetical protein
MRLHRAASLAAVLLIAAALPAEAKSGVNIGSLSCTVEGGVGLIIGSSKDANCVFQKTNGRRERYRGNISKLGIDIGVTDKSYIRWLVFAPGQVGRGALAGSYGGASAEASAGLGLGANVLIGGFKRSIALQPVSVQGQTGLNLAVGISRLKLKLR